MSKKVTKLLVRKSKTIKPTVVNNTGFNPQPEDGSNAKYTKIIMQLNSFPDINLSDDNQVRQRIVDYFALCAEHDFKPTVSSLAAVLGLHRRELYGLINNDTVRFNNVISRTSTYSHSLIKKAYGSMEQLWESYMLNGKINPVSGIFLGKNHYGYVDKVDYVVQAKPTMSEDDLLDRYLEMKDD